MGFDKIITKITTHFSSQKIADVLVLSFYAKIHRFCQKVDNVMDCFSIRTESVRDFSLSSKQFWKENSVTTKIDP